MESIFERELCLVYVEGGRKGAQSSRPSLKNKNRLAGKTKSDTNKKYKIKMLIISKTESKKLPVLWIIKYRIRIRGSVILNNGSRSGLINYGSGSYLYIFAAMEKNMLSNSRGYQII